MCEWITMEYPQLERYHTHHYGMRCGPNICATILVLTLVKSHTFWYPLPHSPKCPEEQITSMKIAIESTWRIFFKSHLLSSFLSVSPLKINTYQQKSMLVGGFIPFQKSEFVRLDHHPQLNGKIQNSRSSHHQPVIIYTSLVI